MSTKEIKTTTIQHILAVDTPLAVPVMNSVFSPIYRRVAQKAEIVETLAAQVGEKSTTDDLRKLLAELDAMRVDIEDWIRLCETVHRATHTTV